MNTPRAKLCETMDSGPKFKTFEGETPLTPDGGLRPEGALTKRACAGVPVTAEVPKLPFFHFHSRLTPQPEPSLRNAHEVVSLSCL